jgi:hypothetical protein
MCMCCICVDTTDGWGSYQPSHNDAHGTHSSTSSQIVDSKQQRRNAKGGLSAKVPTPVDPPKPQLPGERSWAEVSR